MARKVKFALKMKDGAEVRNLQDLQEHFDIDRVMEYYLNGKLSTWLDDRYYEEESDQIHELDSNDPELSRKLCEIFQVEYVREALSPEEIEARNQKIERLRELTDDEEIVAKVDSVAFTQEELAELLDKGLDTIYLCSADLKIPEKIKSKTYIGICTRIQISPEKLERFNKNNIQLINLIEEPEVRMESDVTNDREDGAELKDKENTFKDRILEILQKYTSDNYKIRIAPNPYKKTGYGLYESGFKSKSAARREIEGKLRKAYDYADRCIQTGNRDSLSTRLLEVLIKDLEPDIIEIQTIIENINDSLKKRNSIILERLKEKLNLNELRRSIESELEKELQGSYYQTILESFNWYADFIDYEEWENGAAGLFESKYEYSYDGNEAVDLVDQHLTMAAETFCDIAMGHVKTEVITSIIELASKLESR